MPTRGHDGSHMSTVVLQPVATQNASADDCLQSRCPFQLRNDLGMKPVIYGGMTCWAVKDPVALRYFHLQREEHFVLHLLDGKRSHGEIIDAFEHEFASQRLSFAGLQAFLTSLWQRGLVVADIDGQTAFFLERQKRIRRRKWFSSWGSLLAIRFRGFDPDPMLNRLEPYFRPLLSSWTLFAGLVLLVLATGLVTLQFDTFQRKLPDLHAFFHAGNLVWLAATLCLAKVLHEFAHAMACKCFGGECHEMGLMLLVFTPCLYCDVSDSWMIPNKWKRIAISSAGVLVELVLAAAGTILWWFSEPGLFNALCLNVMFICSVNTLLFNGNPLLRYDGYFILLDWLEVPNLRQQSSALIQSNLTQWFLGITPLNQRALPNRLRKTLIVYAIAAWIYRWVILSAIFWLLYSVLKPHGLERLVWLIAFPMFAALVIIPIWRFSRFLKVQWKQVRSDAMSDNISRRINWSRFLIRGGLVAGVFALLILIPLPLPLKVPTLLEPADAQPVYATVSGFLKESLEIGTDVNAGKPIARLTNPELEREVIALEGEQNINRLRLENLRGRRVQDTDAGDLIPTAEKMWQSSVNRFVQRREDLERLTINAPVSGTLLPARTHQSGTSEGELSSWQGTPLDARNANCYIESGTKLCLIGDANRLEALVVIDESQIDFVEVNQRVKLLLNQIPDRPVWGKVRQIAELDLEIAPPELVANAEIFSQPDEVGRMRPLLTSYLARVELEPHDRKLLIRSTGTAEIEVAPRSLASLIARWTRRTFHFEL